MTDRDIEAAAKKAGGRWQDGSYWVFEDADLHPFARALLAAERERWAPLVAELLDTELGELASAGSHAPVEDILGRLKDVLGPNAQAHRTDTAR